MPPGSMAVVIERTLEANLRWIITEAVHSVNNFLGGIEYAVHFIREDPGVGLEENLALIQERGRYAADTLRALYDLATPSADEAGAVLCRDVLGWIQRLLLKKLQSQRIEFEIDAPTDAALKRSDGRLAAQAFFTFIWIRLNRLEGSGTIRMTARRTGEGWTLAAECPEDPEADRLVERALRETAVRSGAYSREGFALNSLCEFHGGLAESGARPVIAKGSFRFDAANAAIPS